MLNTSWHVVGMLVLYGFGHVAFGVGTSPQEILKLAEGEQPEAMKTWEKLVNVDTGAGFENGLTRLEAMLAGRLKALGADVRVTPASPSAGNNIVGSLRGTGMRKILLMIHYDTVFPPGEAARRPFRLEGDRAHGPGVADAKGGIVIILHSMQMLKELNFDGYGRLTALFNPDEETGSVGSRDLIKELASRHDYVLSYEPPDEDAVTVQTNGINSVILRVKGRASHAGQAPEEGRNAAIELAHQVLELNELGDPKKGTTVNWTILKAGEESNIIPAHAMAEADMRYTDMHETDRVLHDARRIIREHLIPDTEAEIRIERGRPPLLRNEASKKLAALARRIYRDIGRELGAIAMRFGTDAGYAYQADDTRPAVLETLGVIGARLHAPEEFAEVSSVVARLYLSARMIMELSQSD